MGPLATDVFIVGGGPAGLAAGIAARQQGFRVTVADCACPPIDKACGEGLMPDGVEALRALGIAIEPSQAFPFRGIRFLEAGMAAEARFPAGIGLGVRRTTLHRVMAEAASDAGVALLWGRRVTGIGPQGVSLDGENMRCRWIVGADGGNSRVRHWARLDAASTTVRFGFRRHYRIEPWSDFMELYWANGFQVYVTPVRHDEMCLTVIADDPHGPTEHGAARPHRHLEEALAELPELAAHLGAAQPITSERGAVSASRRLPAVYRDNVALLGDASGSVDAITGEGLFLAFQQARALAEAMKAGDLSRYEAAHRRIRKGPARMASMLLTISSRKSVRNRALRALAARPSVFSRMLAMHVSAPSPLKLATLGVALGWRMLLD